MGDYPIERGFTRRLIRPDTWVVQGIDESPASYVLIGKKKALVIDTGLNKNSIRHYIEEITELPLCVASTHGHFDHTGSNGQFKDCPVYMSGYAASECKNVFEYLDPTDFCLDYEPTVIKEKDMIELGDRTIEAIAAGCHSPGSLVYLDRKYRLLFTGDEVESGQVLIHDVRKLGYASVELYLHNLKKLKSYENEFDLICPGHNGTPMDKSILDAFIENCERIMSGMQGKKDLSSPTYLHGRKDDPRHAEKKRMEQVSTYRRSEWKGTSIVYDMEKVFISGKDCT